MLDANPIRRRPRRPARRARGGATLLESSIVLGVSLTLIFGMFDLSLVEFQDDLLSEAARRLARAAATHGALAAPQQTSWGPAAVSANGGDGSEYAAAIAPVLATIPPASVKIALAWLDGDNALGHRVQVQLSYTHAALTPFQVYGQSIALTAESTMLIQH